MDWDEARSKTARPTTVGEDLTALGLAELEARIAALSQEIERVRAEIARKQAHEQAARDVFKS